MIGHTTGICFHDLTIGFWGNDVNVVSFDGSISTPTTRLDKYISAFEFKLQNINVLIIKTNDKTNTK